MSDEPLRLNKTIVLRCATQEVNCIAEKIKKRINSSTLETIEENANELKLCLTSFGNTDDHRFHVRLVFSQIITDRVICDYPE